MKKFLENFLDWLKFMFFLIVLGTILGTIWGFILTYGFNVDLANLSKNNYKLLVVFPPLIISIFLIGLFDKEEVEIEPEENTKSNNTKESETLSKNYDKFLNKYNEYYKNINTYSSFYNQIRCYTENNMFMFSHNGRLDAYTEYLKKEYESNYRMKNKIKGYETLILGYYFLLKTYNKLLDGYSELERYPTICKSQY